MTSSSFSEQQVSAALVVATVVALTWSATTLDGVSRVTTACLAGVVASAAMVAGLRVLE